MSSTLGEVSTTGTGSPVWELSPVETSPPEELPGGVRVPMPLKSLSRLFLGGNSMCFTSSRSMVNMPSCSTWSSTLVSTL